ncbi:MAG TPA: GntR family transcriptional regulator [Candidatus Limiplasma sp.]|nr:GntR family transcriptional regulator [Candidatus Limiplasma sp.]HRX09029.1 GntR family transcriptional regulator [Candidatus Limiplasma sp.]
MDSYSKPEIKNDIVQGIIRGEYREQGLLTERSLMDKYGVTKSTVRDALSELRCENVLRSIPRYGYEIVTLTESEVRNILQFRVMVECQSLPLVFERASQKELSDLVEFMQSLTPTEDQDVWDSWEDNSQFHLHLLMLSGNRYCYEQVQQSLSVLKRAYAQFYWDKWRRMRFRFNNETHIRITNALRNNDVPLASRLLEEDITSFGDAMTSD